MCFFIRLFQQILFLTLYCTSSSFALSPIKKDFVIFFAKKKAETPLPKPGQSQSLPLCQSYKEWKGCRALGRTLADVWRGVEFCQSFTDILVVLSSMYYGSMHFQSRCKKICNCHSTFSCLCSLKAKTFQQGSDPNSMK